MPARKILTSLEDLGRLPTALVAGGAGFIGSFLCEKLLTLKTRVICLDNLETGTKENLINCLSNSNFSFLEQDINKPLKEIPEKIDYIFHLAGIEENLEEKDLTITDLLTNSLGTKNLLDLAVKNQAKFLFCSILDVYFAYLSSRSLDNHFSSFYSHAEAKRYGEALVSEYYRNYNLNSRIVRVSDVFGPRMNFYAKTEINKIFSSALFKKEIEVSGEGLKTIYPTFVFDLIDGLIRAMFKVNTNGKVFNLVGKNYSLINFAYTLKTVIPDLKIIYVRKEEEMQVPVRVEELLGTSKEIGWVVKPVEEGIKITVNYYQKIIPQIKTSEPLTGEEEVGEPKEEEQKSPIISTVKTTEIKKEKKREGVRKFLFLPKISLNKKFSLIFSAIILLFLIIFYPLLAFSWHGFLGYKNLQEIERKKIIKNFETTIKKASSASKNFSLAQKNLERFSWVLKFVGKEKIKERLSLLLFAAEKSSEAISHTLLAGKTLSGFLGAISGELSDDSLVKATEAKLEIKEAKEKFSLVIASLKELRAKGKITVFLGKEIDLSTYEKRVDSLKEELDKLDKILTFIPFLLGQDQRKTYLVLLQNNMELRPTGGFIGSFALITLEDGKMIDFKIEDVYTADGQLKGKVNPPDEILHYLGQPNWYLRDSNFSPDFPLSAKRAAWFLEKELGFLVDGVIGVDLSFAQKLLAAIGEIEVLDYKEKVNAKNLFEIAEKHSEKDFFPGSTQKKNFLTALGKTLFDRVIYSREEKYFDIVLAIFKSLKEKHLFFYFPEEKVQEVFLTLGFAGEIKTLVKTKSPGENFDYLMVVDSNFSANKVNYFVKREIKHEITLGKEYGLVEKVTINYKNNSPTDSWPGGIYKNYLRIIIPQEAVFDTVEISGEEKKPKLISALTEEEIKNLKAEEFLVIEATESGQRKSWGTLIEVPVGKSKSITFSYKEPFEFKENLADYSLYLQKQAGTKEDKYELIFGYPAFLKVKEKSQGVEKPQLIIFNTRLNTDKEFRVRLEK